MVLFFILAPFGAFAMLMLVTSPTISLFVAAAVALGTIVYDVIHGCSVKVLAAGAALIFASLGCYLVLIDAHWSGIAVRLVVDSGVLGIALVSLAMRLPFTLQYARESVDAETQKFPGFLTANYIITWAWTAAFVLMLVADILTIFAPSMPLWIGMAIAFAARNSAVYFTKWYPQYRRRNEIKSAIAIDTPAKS